MITEDYVSFAVSKLLKEKGFDEPCIYVYRHDGSEDIWDADKEDIACQKPTLQMVMKWLREVHNLHCVVDYDFVLGWYCQITSLKETVEYDYEEMKHYHPDEDNGFSSSEEAYEAGIRYVLENLI